MIDVKWTRRNNLFIISLLAEAQRAADMLTRLSGRADRRMWLWEDEGGWQQGMGLGGQRGYTVYKPLTLCEPSKNWILTWFIMKYRGA